MKSKFSFNTHARGGFTLIELLVVIVIIGILASLVMNTATRMMDDARRLQVQTVINDLRIAISSYQVDYNRYPVNPSQLAGSSGGADIQEMLTDENSGIITALMGSSTSSSGGGGAASGTTNLNPRNIKFIDLRVAKNGVFGLVNAQPPYKLVDLWAQPYRVLLDTNGDKQVANPDIGNSDPKISQNQISPVPPMLPTEIAVYSFGKDRKKQTKDDVVSWRQR